MDIAVILFGADKVKPHVASSIAAAGRRISITRTRERWRLTMRYSAIAIGALLTALGSDYSLAYYCEGGQQPVPPAIAAQMALPLCGFAATKRWGPNGCQLCDASNMYPNPFAEYGGPPAGRRVHHHRTGKR
jgi:hypothetical protein